VSTLEELDWIKTKLSSTQSDEESARKRLAEKDGEIGWLKKRPAETQAELEGVKNEAAGLGELISARSGSVSSVSSAGAPPYPTGWGAQGVRPPYPLVQRHFPRFLGLRRRERGLHITGNTVDLKWG